MKKIRLFPILILIAGVMISCGQKKTSENQNTMRSGYIKIAVDQTLQNVIQQEIDVFEGLYPAIIEPIFTTEQEAIELLKLDTVRLAITARNFSAAELAYFHEKTFQPEAYRIAIDGIALITHPSNKDSVISRNDVKRILTGEVTQWNQIYPGSRLGKIQVVFDNTKSSIVRYANDSICREKPLSNELNALELNEEVVEHVAKVPGALGLIGVNHISDENDSTVIDFTNKVRVMRVSYEDKATPNNSVQPYQYYLYNAEYPYRREIFILLNDPRGELPKGFSRFVTSDQGQRIIKRTGLLPSTMPIQAVKIVEQ
ncbi:MAG: phosphate ABC transporter substrate-binding protein [Porphyromonadaceae bacterium]|nr:phosphate ABC transporter substrate-binding protein [Porphyromonadaceae bacterium]